MSENVLRGLVLFFGLALGAGAGHAAPNDDLVAALSRSKVSLADGVRQIAKSEGQPLSAKFEFDDDAKLSLSVYVAAKGHPLIPLGEGRVLMEMAGSPETGEWKPQAEVFKDVEHVARASQQLTLMSLAGTTVLELVDDAQKSHAGVVFSITPEIRRRRAVAVVLVADGGKVAELVYDLSTGALLPEGGGR